MTHVRSTVVDVHRALVYRARGPLARYGYWRWDCRNCPSGGLGPTWGRTFSRAREHTSAPARP